MLQTNYAGSLANYTSVKRQIAERFSEEEAESYDPKTNCMTYKMWQRNGFYVVPGEKGLTSTVIITKKDQAGKIISRYPKRVALFCRLQVRPMT